MANERKFTQEGVKRVMLRRYIQKATEREGFGGVTTTRTPLGTRIELTVERPGLVIGTKGRAIKKLTDELRAWGCENPLIEIIDVRQPALNANIMARKLADALERGWHFRRACHSTVRRIMEAGAKGCEVTVSGKLTGRRHRMNKFVAGHIKHCGEPTEQWMSVGMAIAHMKPGVIGVKVRIMDPNAILPDEFLPEKRMEKEKGKEEEEKGEGEAMGVKGPEEKGVKGKESVKGKEKEKGVKGKGTVEGSKDKGIADGSKGKGTVEGSKGKETVEGSKDSKEMSGKSNQGKEAKMLEKRQEEVKPQEGEGTESR